MQNKCIDSYFEKPRFARLSKDGHACRLAVKMKKRTGHHIAGIVATAPFVFFGWYLIILGSFVGFALLSVAYLLLWAVFVAALTRGNARIGLKDSPWALDHFKIRSMTSYTRDVLASMRTTAQQDRKSLLGEPMTNRLLSIDQPADSGAWHLELELCNDVLVAYSARFVSEESPYSDVGISRSSRNARFLRLGDD